MKKFIFSMFLILSLVLSISVSTGCDSDDSGDAATYTLTVNDVNGGTIMLSPAGGSYEPGTEVTVTVEADETHKFIGWSGDLSGTTNPAKITMDSAKTIGATLEGGYYRVELDAATNGSVSVTPPIPADGKIKGGTELTLTATPDPGYVLDSCYKMIWIMEAYNYGYFMESMKSPSKVVIDPNDGRFQVYGPSNVYKLGASFIAESELAGINVTQNVEYAKPGNKSLVYDVYSPDGATDLPCVVIIHGGGWSSNTEDIMRGMGREIAKTGKYVVFSIEYRLLSDLDASGTPEGVTAVDIIEDVFGAIAHIQDNAATYGGDSAQIAVTGDSAGGHLAAVVANMSGEIGTAGFDGTNFEFWPTGVAEGDVPSVRTEIMAAVQAAAPSYGVFDISLDTTSADQMYLFNDNSGTANSDYYAAISPINFIGGTLPPQHCQIGSIDFVVSPLGVKAYVDALVAEGHTAEYVEVAGANHAYFDWKPDAMTKATFNSTGKTQLAAMIAFFDGIFYP